jgi:Ca2+-binding EF-hand superfamily protein
MCSVSPFDFPSAVHQYLSPISTYVCVCVYVCMCACACVCSAPLQAFGPDQILQSGITILERSRRGLHVYRALVIQQHDEESKHRDIEDLLCSTTFNKSELEALHRQFQNLATSDGSSTAPISSQHTGGGLRGHSSSTDSILPSALQCTKGLRLAQFTELMHSIYTSPIDICPKLFDVFDVRRTGRVSFRECR